MKGNELIHQQKHCQDDYLNTFYYPMDKLVIHKRALSGWKEWELKAVLRLKGWNEHRLCFHLWKQVCSQQVSLERHYSVSSFPGLYKFPLMPLQLRVLWHFTIWSHNFRLVHRLHASAKGARVKEVWLVQSTKCKLSFSVVQEDGLHCTLHVTYRNVHVCILISESTNMKNKNT